jgi:ABC-type multidrug transport system fused ATPase/permease subunit
LGNVDVRDLRLRELRGAIGVVAQDTRLFNESIIENIRYGAPTASDQDVIQAARNAHAHQFITEVLEDGYQTVVGQGGSRLSGGQRQRIALARAMLRDPAVFILDEATSQIDSESERLIHAALANFVRGRTTVMISHRVSTLALADRIAVMEAGRIVDFGTHDELMKRCPIFRTLNDRQPGKAA